MSFYNQYQQYKHYDFNNFLANIREEDVQNALSKESLAPADFLTLLSPRAGDYLEIMARKAQQLTHHYFGKVIFLYAPLYLGNYCVNSCAYCGFSMDNNIPRSKLSLGEVEEEAGRIAETGIRHILLLSGESRKHTPVSYIQECVEVVKKYFSSISIEIYPLETEEYAELIGSGIDGLTIYQEVYDEKMYDTVHISGPKKDYLFRLDAPERGCRAGMRKVNIGTLLGLGDWRRESFLTGIHAKYLQDTYLDTEISLSVPRYRPHAGSFQLEYEVDDRSLVQIILAFRLLLPRAGITVSTRERAGLRDNLIGLGITRMSAGSSTEVGGYSGKGKSEAQFKVADDRSVKEIARLIYTKGYQPVFKDWQFI